MEEAALKDIFKDKLSITQINDTTTYKFLFKNKEYVINTDKFYPKSLPRVDGLDTEKYKKYLGKPIIYLLFLECIKMNENNFDTQEEFISTIKFQSVDKITEQQFLEFKSSRIKQKKQKEGMSGRDMFVNNL